MLFDATLVNHFFTLQSLRQQTERSDPQFVEPGRLRIKHQTCCILHSIRKVWRTVDNFSEIEKSLEIPGQDINRARAQKPNTMLNECAYWWDTCSWWFLGPLTNGAPYEYINSYKYKVGLSWSNLRFKLPFFVYLFAYLLRLRIMHN